MSQNSYSGYLVVADISGYTSYLATTELAHSQEVLAELLELIIFNFRPLLTIVRLEGDAVFAHAPAGQILRGESLAELLEGTYTAFRDHIRGIVQRTTCECNACRSIPSLDLKFIVHFGDYVMQEVSGIKELAGTEVNRLFRLGKNHVAEETGWNAYILYTDASLQESGISPVGMHVQLERYEHLGEVTTHALDLHKRYQEITEARYVKVTPEEAHAVVSFDFPFPPPIVWEWLNDPRRRNQIAPENTWSATDRPGGRTGAGASNHCAHGKNSLVCETILDWRPFEYTTSLKTNKKTLEKLFDMTETISLEAIKDGTETRVEWIQKLAHVPGFLARPALKGFHKIMREQFLLPMLRTMQEEYGLLDSGQTAPAGKTMMPAEAS